MRNAQFFEEVSLHDFEKTSLRFIAGYGNAKVKNCLELELLQVIVAVVCRQTFKIPDIGHASGFYENPHSREFVNSLGNPVGRIELF